MAKEKADKANAEAEEAKAAADEDEDEESSPEATSNADSDDEDSDDEDSDDEDEEDEDMSNDDEVTKAEGPDAKKRGSDHPPAKSAKDDHGHGAHDDHDDHGLAHTMPIKGLIGVWAALMVLTVLTVSVTRFDMGYTLNLVIAMVIATVKAALVMLFFMHLWWDKRFNVLIFLSSFLFVALFVGLTVNDRGEYQRDINAYDDAKAQ